MSIHKVNVNSLNIYCIVSRIMSHLYLLILKLSHVRNYVGASVLAQPPVGFQEGLIVG